MNILVCVKAVPASTEVRLDPVTHTIIRSGQQSVINPFDAAAVELAVRMKRQRQAEITVLSMGIPATANLLKDLIARGADEGVLLSDRAFAGADTLATSYTLAAAVRRMGIPDLILCGKMAVDGDTAQIGPELAAKLDIPAVTNVKRIAGITEKEIRVIRDSDVGEQEVTVSLPALLTVVKSIADPRMPSIAGIRAAEGKQISVLDCEDLGTDPEKCGLRGSPTQVVRTFAPRREKETVWIRGDAAEAAETIRRLTAEEL